MLKNLLMLSILKLKLQICFFSKIRTTERREKKFSLSFTTSSWSNIRLPQQVIWLQGVNVGRLQCLTTVLMNQ